MQREQHAEGHKDSRMLKMSDFTVWEQESSLVMGREVRITLKSVLVRIFIAVKRRRDHCTFHAKEKHVIGWLTFSEI